MRCLCIFYSICLIEQLPRVICFIYALREKITIFTVWLCVLGETEADVVVIGSGIGGLCCGALLARYNQDVLVLESHDLPGGAAHSFEIKGYKFDSGPSLFSGLQSRGLQANPLAQVNSCFSSLTLFGLG